MRNRESETIEDSNVWRNIFMMQIERNIPKRSICRRKSHTARRMMILINAINQSIHHSISCCIYQLSGIYFRSIFSISSRDFPVRSCTYRYAGPALQSHCQSGCSRNLSIPSFIRSICPFVDHPRMRRVFIVPAYCTKMPPMTSRQIKSKLIIWVRYFL